jgi:hypothetical protein
MNEDIRKVERLWDDCPGGIRYYWQGNEDCEHKNDTVNEEIDIRSMNREGRVSNPITLYPITIT